MGEAKRRQQMIYKEVIELLTNCSNSTLEYPLDEYSGVINNYIPTICKAYQDWQNSSNKNINLRLKLVEKWIVSFDYLTEDGDAINVETKLIAINLPVYFRKNFSKLLRSEAINKNIPENEVEDYIRGNLFYFSLTQYCLEKLIDLPNATEATVSQAIFFPKTNTYDAGYPIPFEDSSSLKKENFREITRANPKFRNFFKEYDFDFN